MPSYFPFMSQDWPTWQSEAKAGQQGAPAVRSKGGQCQEPDPRIFLPIHPSLALGLLMPLQNLHLPLCLQPYRSHLFSTTATIFLIIHPFAAKLMFQNVFYNVDFYLQRIFETSWPDVTNCLLISDATPWLLGCFSATPAFSSPSG